MNKTLHLLENRIRLTGDKEKLDRQQKKLQQERLL